VNSAQFVSSGGLDGWFQPSTLSSVAVFSHWVAFIILFGCTLFLASESWRSKGPSGREVFYAGYREENNLAFFVNLFATFSYFGKIVADTVGHNYDNSGPLLIGVGNYKYADYMLTCPLLVYDLLYQLRAPYRYTSAGLIFGILMCGVVAEFYPGSHKLMKGGALAWYAFGCFWFAFAYALIMTIVIKQYRRMESLADGTQAVAALRPLKFALCTFFGIWVMFPIIWVLSDRGFGVIDESGVEIVHCICDIVAKSFYGFALAKFRRNYDRKMFELIEALGHDAEEEFENLERDMRPSSDGAHLRRLSSASMEWNDSMGDDRLCKENSMNSEKIPRLPSRNSPRRSPIASSGPVIIPSKKKLISPVYNNDNNGNGNNEDRAINISSLQPRGNPTPQSRDIPHPTPSEPVIGEDGEEYVWQLIRKRPSPGKVGGVPRTPVRLPASPVVGPLSGWPAQPEAPVPSLTLQREEPDWEEATLQRLEAKLRQRLGVLASGRPASGGAGGMPEMNENGGEYGGEHRVSVSTEEAQKMLSQSSEAYKLGRDMPASRRGEREEVGEYGGPVTRSERRVLDSAAQVLTA